MEQKKTRKKRSPMERSNIRTFYIIMMPFLIMFLIYRLFPMAWGVYISFTNYSGFNLGSLKYVGIEFKATFSSKISGISP